MYLLGSAFFEHRSRLINSLVPPENASLSLIMMVRWDPVGAKLAVAENDMFPLPKHQQHLPHWFTMSLFQYMVLKVPCSLPSRRYIGIRDKLLL
jgi:hypothetical protein